MTGAVAGPPSRSLPLHHGGSLRSSLRQDLGFVVAALVLSRLLFLGAAIATQAVLLGLDADIVRYADLRSALPRLAERLVLHGDGGWYLTIVENGYEPGPFRSGRFNWAFFPLLPTLVSVLGGSVVAGLVLTNGALLAATVLLRAEVARMHGRSVARWTVLFLAFAPFSHVFSIFRPESLMLLGAVAAWMAARRERWLLAWAAVAVAVLARPTGVLVGILVLAELVRARPTRLALPRALAGAALPVLAVGAFSAYLGMRTGDPLAWSHVLRSWAREADLETFIARYTGGGLVLVRSYDFAAANAVAAVVGGLAGLRLLWRRRFGLGLYQGAAALVSPITGGTLISELRYLLVGFPLYILLAEDRRLRPYRVALLVASAMLFALVAAWLTAGSLAVVA